MIGEWETVSETNGRKVERLEIDGGFIYLISESQGPGSTPANLPPVFVPGVPGPMAKSSRSKE